MAHGRICSAADAGPCAAAAPRPHSGRRAPARRAQAVRPRRCAAPPWSRSERCALQRLRSACARRTGRAGGRGPRGCRAGGAPRTCGRTAAGRSPPGAPAGGTTRTPAAPAPPRPPAPRPRTHRSALGGASARRAAGRCRTAARCSAWAPHVRPSRDRAAGCGQCGMGRSARRARVFQGARASAPRARGGAGKERRACQQAGEAHNKHTVTLHQARTRTGAKHRQSSSTSVSDRGAQRPTRAGARLVAAKGVPAGRHAPRVHQHRCKVRPQQQHHLSGPARLPSRPAGRPVQGLPKRARCVGQLARGTGGPEQALPDAAPVSMGEQGPASGCIAAAAAHRGLRQPAGRTCSSRPCAWNRDGPARLSAALASACPPRAGSSCRHEPGILSRCKSETAFHGRTLPP
jgi:hypothetical protein